MKWLLGLLVLAAGVAAYEILPAVVVIACDRWFWGRRRKEDDNGKVEEERPSPQGGGGVRWA